MLRTLAALFRGSSSTLPSMLPKMLWPTQLMTSRCRAANIGASTLLSSVSPVLPSQPAWAIFRSIATCCRHAGVAPVDGVKFTYEAPASAAARK